MVEKIKPGDCVIAFNNPSPLPEKPKNLHDEWIKLKPNKQPEKSG